MMPKVPVRRQIIPKCHIKLLGKQHPYLLSAPSGEFSLEASVCKISPAAHRPPPFFPSLSPPPPLPLLLLPLLPPPRLPFPLPTTLGPRAKRSSC